MLGFFLILGFSAPQLFHGTFLHTVSGKLDILKDTYITVENGKIKNISKNRPEGEFDIFETAANQIILPGLIDTHIHAPQYIFTGVGYDLQLLEWLNKYTFPAEAMFSDVETARKVYESIVNKTISFGTTTASYFATIHSNSSLLLGEICRQHGQRAFIGKVSMDRNSPDYYVEKTDAAIEDANQFVEKFDDDEDLVQAIVTPRFVPSCSPKLMTALSNITKKHPGMMVQTHISESTSEIDLVKELHPEAKDYASVYDEFGLLTDRTILAHAVHITDDEIKLLAERGASIAHCPSSNFMLYSGIANIRKIMDAGITVGLGTDVSGGPTPSIIDAMRNALICSRANLFQFRKEGKEFRPLETVDVFSLATEGGAKALHIDDKVGNFKVGKEFDAIVVDMTKGMSDCFTEETPEHLLEKFIQLADDRNIIRVYVRGNLVKSI